MNLNIKRPLEKTPYPEKLKNNSYDHESVLAVKNMEKDGDKTYFDKLTFNVSRSVWDGFLLISANKIRFAS